MPNQRLTRFILACIFFLSSYLFIAWVAIHEGLKERHHEFQELVLISGVLDSFETVPYPNCWDIFGKGNCFINMFLSHRQLAKIMGRPTNESGHSIEELRLRLRGDPHLYVIDSKVIQGFNWKKFSAKKPVGTSVSLKVEQAQLSQWKPSGKRRRIMVYELEFSSGKYLTLEESLREIRAEGSALLIFGGGILGIVFLFTLTTIVVIIW